jgi:tungstate transport system permease protein
MEYILQGLREAFQMIFAGDGEVYRIAAVSIKISSISTSLASLVGVPVGFYLAFSRFPGRRAVITLLRTLLALPTVVVGLVLYSLLSRSGPFGGLRMMYTQTAMVIGQFVLASPIVTMLTLSALAGVDKRVRPTALTLGATPFQSNLAVLWEGSFALAAAIATGFGRVFGEVGVSMMLGGNIRHYTRNLTTGIAFQTSRGEFSLGLALGVILLAVALGANLLVRFLEMRSSKSTD